MVELFIAGDPLFMGLLSCPLVAMMIVALNPYHQLLSGFDFANDHARRQKAIRSIGLFALIFGLFSQLLWLYGALASIRMWGQVEVEMLYNGIGICFINAGYGAIIFGLGYLLSKLEWPLFRASR